MKEGCLFCKLANGVIPTEIIMSGEYAVMIRDANPVAPRHLLIMPKEHYGDLGDLLPTEYATILAEMFLLIDDYVCLYRLDADGGYRVVINTGKNAGQTVKHFHLHLIAGAPLKNDFGA